VLSIMVLRILGTVFIGIILFIILLFVIGTIDGRYLKRRRKASLEKTKKRNTRLLLTYIIILSLGTTILFVVITFME